MSTARERLYADFEDQDRYDYDPLTDLGPIQVAIMGEGRITLYGEGETLELSMERPPLEDLGTPKELKGERAINHGSAYAPLLGIGEAQTEGDPDPDAIQDTRGLTESQIGSLMKRTNRDQSKVNWHGDSVPSGGGGSGTGRAKEATFRGKEPQKDEAGEAPDTVRCKVTGLTAGEREFYARQGSSEARGVLRRYVAALVQSHEAAAPTKCIRVKPSARDLFVYGLEEWEVQVLRKRPGSAARVLGIHAREQAKQLVEKYDSGEDELLALDRQEAVA